MSQPPARRPPPPGRGGAPGTNPRPNPTPDTNQHPRGAPPGRGGPARGNRGGGRSLPQKPTTAPPQKRVNMPKPNNTPSGIPDGATRGAPRAGPGPGRPNKPAPPPRPPGETNVPDVHSQKPVITPQVNVNLGAVARSRAPSVTPVPGGPPRASVVNATPPAVIAAAPPKDIPPEGSPEAIASQKRLNIVKEIVSTEQTYNTALDIMVNHYQKPITAAAETVLLPETLKEDVSAVFSNASHILPISKTLLETVRQFADNWTPDMQLGPTFLKMAPFFRIYNKYQNNYERAVETLTKCQKDEIFNQFVDAIDAVVKAEVKDEKATVKLESLIIMPVQRIPRIILLLGELQRKTPDTHPDKDILGQAIEALDEVMNYLDKDITSEEFREKFLAMGSKFKGASELIKAHRVLVDEATITLKDTKEPATGLKSKLIQQQKLRIWLFNDVLVHLKTNKSKKKTNVASTEHTWPLQLVWLKDEPDDAVIDPKMPYSFMLVGPRKSYFLKFAEQNEKKAWYDKIQKQITANLTDENSDESDPMKRFCYYKFPGKHNAEYEGWWHFGKLHGQGSFKIMSNVYKGDFESDRKSGTGTFSSVTGEVYHGEWKEDRPNGYGQLMYTNKDRYEGLWKDGLRHGKGIHYYSNGDCYDGEWSQDIQSGSGKYTTTTGFLYTGSWLAGKVHGEGVLIAPNGRRYDGEFKSGLKCGEGFMDYNNGECYVGQWNMDKPNGFGIFTSVVDGTYVGTFVNGMKEGTGRQTYLNGDYYEGGFKKNLFHDRGSLVISSGGLERYDGKWENGKFCGKGICTIRGLGKLEGEFKDDKPHGAGTFSSKGGTFFDGKWVDGRRDGKATICTRDDKFACTCTKGMMGKREASFLVISDIPTFHLEL